MKLTEKIDGFISTPKNNDESKHCLTNCMVGFKGQYQSLVNNELVCLTNKYCPLKAFTDSDTHPYCNIHNYNEEV